MQRDYDYVCESLTEATEEVESAKVRIAECQEELKMAKSTLRHAQDELRSWQKGIVPPFAKPVMGVAAGR